MVVNKLFFKKVRQYLVASLEEELQAYSSLLLKMDKPLSPSESSFDPSSSKVQFSAKTIKAVDLLNESVINKLFTESKVPSNDIVLIYIIYFQLINHPIVNEADNRKAFWKKCCSYFTLETNGKTGDLLKRTLTQSIVTAPENMYRLAHRISNHLNKITPTYFSKLCGTTGLIVFFIQDALEHLGFFNDKKVKGKGYQLYEDIIRVIGYKIDKLKSYMK